MKKNQFVGYTLEEAVKHFDRVEAAEKARRIAAELVFLKAEEIRLLREKAAPDTAIAAVSRLNSWDDFEAFYKKYYDYRWQRYTVANPFGGWEPAERGKGLDVMFTIMIIHEGESAKYNILEELEKRQGGYSWEVNFTGFFLANCIGEERGWESHCSTLEWVDDHDYGRDPFPPSKLIVVDATGTGWYRSSTLRTVARLNGRSWVLWHEGLERPLAGDGEVSLREAIKSLK